MIAYLDCSTGVSGDKLLGALIDAGFDVTVLCEMLARMGLGSITVDVRPQKSGGMRAIGVSVTEWPPRARSWLRLRELLEAAPLEAPVHEYALAALDALVRAEAAVHGVPPEDVHFHELGAADTIVDVLGTALGFCSLGIDTLVVSPIALGSGSITTEHGTLPVPTPATSLLLKGLPIETGPVAGELTTPTGAALVGAFAGVAGPLPPMVLRRVGYGCGERDIGVPNVCQLFVGEPTGETACDQQAVANSINTANEAAEAATLQEPVTILETNLDHLSAEEIALVATRLRSEGALDVWLTPILMKKDRPGTLLSALSRARDACRLAELIITTSGTLGVRVIPATRRLVQRDVTELETTLGLARFKVAYLPDGSRRLRVESDDAERIAAAHALAPATTARMLEAEASAITGIQPMRQNPSSDTTSPSR